jgi:hypothetical protein
MPTMGWVEERLQNQRDSQMRDSAATAAEDSFQRKARAKWASLLGGFQQDVEEFRGNTGKAEFDLSSDTECRISSPQARITVLVIADLAQHAIRYRYEPEDSRTAVPEQGVLTLRASGNSLDVYSADQRLSSDEARKLILEPLLFPEKPKSLSSAA